MALHDDMALDGFTGRDPAERSAFNRIFYRNRRPTWLGHWVSQCFCWLARIGFANGLNKFNRTMNLGHQLAKWFKGAFGSTQYRDVTACDFSKTVGVNQYVETGLVSRCQAIAQQVAVEVDRMIDSEP